MILSSRYSPHLSLLSDHTLFFKEQICFNIERFVNSGGEPLALAVDSDRARRIDGREIDPRLFIGIDFPVVVFRNLSRDHICASIK